MPEMPFTPLEDYVSLNELCDVVARLQRDLNYLLNGQIDFENIRAHSVVADNMSVDQLSAIAADLGHITAGLVEAVNIFGSHIATANGTYPRIEFSSQDVLLTAFSDALNKLSITPAYGGAPGMSWTAAGDVVGYLISTTLGPLFASFSNTDLSLQASKDLNFTVNNGNITINGSVGQTVTLPYVKAVIAGTAIPGTLTFTKGLLTSYT